MHDGGWQIAADRGVTRNLPATAVPLPWPPWFAE
jgi:hypothetical protein